MISLLDLPVVNANLNAISVTGVIIYLLHRLHSERPSAVRG